jgi:hypothetical protein
LDDRALLVRIEPGEVIKNGKLVSFCRVPEYSCSMRR